MRIGHFGTVALLGVGTLVGAGASFLTSAYLARHLGPALYGQFAAALAGMGLLVPIASMGLSQFWMQVHAEEGVLADRWKPASSYLLLYGFLITCTISIASASLVAGSYPAALLILLIGHVAGQSANDLVGSRLQMDGSYGKLSLIQLIPHLARLTLVFSISGTLLRVELVAAIYCAVGVVMLVGAWRPLSCMLDSNVLHAKGRQVLSDSNMYPSATLAIGRSWPFLLSGLFHLIYFQSNVVALAAIAGSSAAGIYSVAFSLVAATYLIPGVIYQKFLLPKLYVWRVRDRNYFIALFKVGTVAMGVLGCVIALVIWIAGERLIHAIFGNEYRDAVSILTVLSLAIPFLFVSHSAGGVLISNVLSKRKAAIMGGVAIFNILSCLLLVPKFGALGAAYAFAFSNMVLALSYLGAVHYALRKESLL